jgi:hypothetical protein
MTYHVIESRRRIAAGGGTAPSTATDDFISLKEAANIAYERLRDARSIYALAAERLGYEGKNETRSDAILSWFAYLIAPKIPVWGKHPPSRLREEIDKAELKRSAIVKGGNGLRYYDEKEPRYIGLEVRKADLERVIEQLQRARADEPLDEFIPVREAVIQVNDALHGTPFAETILGWSEGYSKDDEKIAMAGRVLSHEIALHGVKPLTSIRRPIDINTIEITMAEWTNGGSILRKMNTKEVLYSDLAFKKHDIEAFVQRTLRGSSGD